MSNAALDPSIAMPVPAAPAISEPLTGKIDALAPPPASSPAVEHVSGPVTGAPTTAGHPFPSPVFNNHNHINVSVNAPAPVVVVTPPRTGHSIIIRALWFVCIGWWLSAVVIVASGLLALTFFGLPLTFMLINKLPQATTLRARNMNWAVNQQNGVTIVSQAHTKQHNIFLRALYFYAVGLWAGTAWLVLAWAVGVLIVTLPITLWMYDRAPAIYTLHKH